jgi:hypothetical protein
MASGKKSGGNQSEPLTEQEALHQMGRIASEAISKANLSVPTGSCVYTTKAGNTFCAVVTEEQCRQLNGTWTPGGTCS